MKQVDIVKSMKASLKKEIKNQMLSLAEHKFKTTDTEFGFVAASVGASGVYAYNVRIFDAEYNSDNTGIVPAQGTSNTSRVGDKIQNISFKVNLQLIPEWGVLATVPVVDPYCRGVRILYYKRRNGGPTVASGTSGPNGYPVTITGFPTAQFLNEYIVVSDKYHKFITKVAQANAVGAGTQHAGFSHDYTILDSFILFRKGQVIDVDITSSLEVPKTEDANLYAWYMFDYGDQTTLPTYTTWRLQYSLGWEYTDI